VYPLKPITKDAVPKALEKAMRYRMLNEAREAESICLDVLAIDPRHQEALVTLILALTDQFKRGLGSTLDEARALLSRIEGEYERAYFGGIVIERAAKAKVDQGGPGVGPVVHAWLVEAMASFERAARLRPAGNDDAILRWNTCARILNGHGEFAPAPPETQPDFLE